MDFNIRKTDDFKLVFVGSDPKNEDERIKSLKEKKYFKAENGECFLDNQTDRPCLYVGLGEDEEKTADSIKTAAMKAGKSLAKIECEKAYIDVLSSGSFDTGKQALAICEGLLNAGYCFNNYKKDKDDFAIKELNFNPACTGQASEKDFIELGHKWQGIKLTRDLVNTPAIDMYPEILADQAMKLAELGVKVTIYGEEEIEEIGMTAFLSVAKGSAKPARLIVLELNPGQGQPLALVGKGLTYDSGGYSLKPSKSMKDMKSDMAGGASVIGTIKALALAGCQKPVVGVVAACENLISGAAYKPGDIVPSLAGLNIEVDNTDAEGRLTLADAVCYAERTFKPKMILDIATLTGACVVALGEHYSGVLGNSKERVDQVKAAAREEDEKIWELPATEDFRKLNESKIADIHNTGGSWGGASAAGLFVGAFIDKCDWVHIDIAGPAYKDKPYLYEPMGGTGHMVKTLYRLAKDF